MEQPILFQIDEKEFSNIQEASHWASHYLHRVVTTANISYLIQYGRIKKYGSNGKPLIRIDELKQYYDSYEKEIQWKQKLGDDLNWQLSFIEYKESERTKHVHRLHPYKGKFIPQLVEYFLDSHTDKFKQENFFNRNDIVLDPFCGSGTTLVQANELGLHAIGIDISAFNTMISNVKINKHDILQLKDYIAKLTLKLNNYIESDTKIAFEEELLQEIAQFNSKYFPSPEYKRKIIKGEINEKEYAKNKEGEFISIYNALVKKYKIKILQDKNNTFLDKWFLFPVRDEIDFMFTEFQKINNDNIKEILSLILSRTVRSCRATTHADLATLKEPITATYYCKKHGKVCKPIFSIKDWWGTYSVDTIKRFYEFDKLRTETFQICLTGDSRTIDIYKEVEKAKPELSKLILKKKIKGIFSSPPYVGLIDYHEQHAYSYEMFGYDRNDELEIGPLANGQGKKAKDSYTIGIADVLKNCKKYLLKNYDIFLVANDKYNYQKKLMQGVA